MLFSHYIDDVYRPKKLNQARFKIKNFSRPNWPLYKISGDLLACTIKCQHPSTVVTVVFAKFPFQLGLAYSIAQHLVVIFLGNVYSFLISCHCAWIFFNLRMAAGQETDIMHVHNCNITCRLPQQIFLPVWAFLVADKSTSQLKFENLSHRYSQSHVLHISELQSFSHQLLQLEYVKVNFICSKISLRNG